MQGLDDAGGARPGEDEPPATPAAGKAEPDAKSETDKSETDKAETEIEAGDVADELADFA